MKGKLINQSPSSSASPRFQTTAWTQIAIAASSGVEDASSREALENLCSSYWFPIYAFVRRRGHGRAAAEDLTQGFFFKLLDQHYLRDVDRERGRFRTFLLASLKHFLSNEREYANAKRRGGDATTLSLDFSDAEQRFTCEPADTWTAEAIFDREWAIALLSRVLQRLSNQYAANNKSDLLDALKPRLLDNGDAGTISDLATRLGTTTGALKVALHRMRKDYKELLIAEVTATVGPSDDAESERKILMTALAGPSTKDLKVK